MLRSLWIAAGIFFITMGPSFAAPSLAAAGKRHRPSAPPRPSHAPLAAQMQAILNDPANAGAEWGISVTTLEGSALYQHNDEQRFAAASNTKLLTTAAALALLGPQFTTTTRVVAPTGLAQATVRGDLVLVGAGDTSMSARVLPYALRTARSGDPLAAYDDLAAQVARSGIREVMGNIVGDDTWFAHQPWANGWEWNDLQWEYGAPVSALVTNDNVQYLSIAPGDAVGSPPVYSWLPQIAQFTLESTVQTVAAGAGVKTALGAQRLPGSRTVRLWGTIPVGAQPASMALAVNDPAVYAAEALKERLEVHGVRVDGVAVARHRESSVTGAGIEPVDIEAVSTEAVGVEAAGTGPASQNPSSGIPANSVTNGLVVASRISPPLLEDVTVINKVSQNLHAEVTLLQLNAANSGDRADALAVERRFLQAAGIAGRDFLLRDGSGLSRDDMMTPRGFTALLRYAATQAWGAAWKASLPVGGEDGSLANRFAKPPLRGQVFAKTGTLEQDAALTGYVTAASGRTIVFSILCDRHLPGGAARADIDRMVAAIAAVD